MRLGEMRHRISLQSKTISKAEGIPQESWATVATVWAAINNISGKEYFKAASIQSEMTTLIIIRYRPGITSAMRVLYNSRVFIILSAIDKDERHREIELLCKEVIPGS